MDLFSERRAVALGLAKPASLQDAFAPMKLDLEKLTGLKFPTPKPLTADSIDDFCKMPEVDLKKLLEFPKPPAQDRSRLSAATAAMKAKASQLRSYVPPAVSAAYGMSLAKAEEATRRQFGFGLAEHFEEAKKTAESGRLTYTVDRFNHPTRKGILELPQKLEELRKNTIGQIKAAFPEKYPSLPEAKILLDAAAKKKTVDAAQAIWRWIVSPDERNTALAMEAGNGAAGTAEGLLAYTAAWSFGDLAPEGTIGVPVPPELPGTGLNSALLMMALDQEGHRAMAERYELYFKLGMDVVFGKSLWPNDVYEAEPPHARILAERPVEKGVAR